MADELPDLETAREIAERARHVSDCIYEIVSGTHAKYPNSTQPPDAVRAEALESWKVLRELVGAKGDEPPSTLHPTGCGCYGEHREGCHAAGLGPPPRRGYDMSRCYGTHIRKSDKFMAGDHCRGCGDCEPKGERT